MLGKIIWHQTGDELLLDVVQPNLFSFYVNQQNITGTNCFHALEPFNVPDIVKNLQKNLSNISKLVDKIPIEITKWDGDLLDQDYLNQLHREWVKIGIKYPKILLLLRKLGGADKDYRDINENIHKIERSFELVCRNYIVDPWQCVNPFGTQVLSFHTGNLMLGFDNLGRATWDKFRFLDDNVSDTDTNDFQMLSGILHLNVFRPLECDPPKNYLQWCKEHQVQPKGANIVLANFSNLGSNIKHIRKVLIKNFHEQSNTFFLEI